MERAAHRVADNETVGQGAVIMRRRRQPQDFIAPPGKNDVLVADLSGQHPAIRQLVEEMPAGEIHGKSYARLPSLPPIHAIGRYMATRSIATTQVGNGSISAATSPPAMCSAPIPNANVIRWLAAT